MNKNFLEHNFILVPSNQEDIPLQKNLISTALSLKPCVVWYNHINLKKGLLDKPFLSRFGCVLVANLVWRGYTISLTAKENCVNSCPKHYTKRYFYTSHILLLKWFLCLKFDSSQGQICLQNDSCKKNTVSWIIRIFCLDSLNKNWLYINK